MSGELSMQASWVEISRGALAQNVRALRSRLAARTKLGVVVKADAYGHGLAPVSRVLVDEGVDWLVVNFAHEATAVRAAGVAPSVPLYVCGTLLPFEAPAVVDARARAVLYDVDVATALDRAARAAGAGTQVPVHIKIETGTHRQGLLLHDALALGKRVAGMPGLVLEGLTTHFADIEDTIDHRFAGSQLEGLQAAARAFADAGMPVPMVHAANSAATLLRTETQGDLVRAGIAAYGLWPSRETWAALLERSGGAQEAPALAPVLSWRARLAQVKDVPAGGYVGYGRTFRATHAMRIGIVPVGYHEGYDRRLSNVAHMIVDGKRAPVRGRVCMNMTMVDVTDIPNAKAGAVVTLLGHDGDEHVSAEQLASWMGTIHYEVVSRIHATQPRLLT